MSEQVYEELADALLRAGGAVPVLKCEELTALNRELFTPEEAALAAVMPPGLHPAETIAREAGRPLEEVVRLLEGLADKALVFHQKRDGLDLYKLMPVLPGFFEFQFMRGGVSDRDRRLARLFQDYFDRAWAVTEGVDPRVLKSLTPFSRVIPVEKEIEGGNVVHPYEKVSEYIRNADLVSVSTCYCRHHGELLDDPCGKPKENCMAFGPNARFAADRGYGRLVSREEALAILDEAEKAGLVHMSSNMSKHIDFICNCCACHCGVLKSFQKMEMPSLGAVSAFRLKVDEERCVGCEACVDRCPMDALEMHGDVVRVNPKRCIGCGVCNSACPEGALSMERIPDAPVPPWDRKALTSAVLESIRKASGGLG
jgi:Na+-translocating ferredoxin:NAD+ oxidoreductase subunit B